jgi:hypothetical protein
MYGQFDSARTIAAAALPIGLYAAYIALLVVPEMVRIDVPTVVQTVAAQ